MFIMFHVMVTMTSPNGKKLLSPSCHFSTAQQEQLQFGTSNYFATVQQNLDDFMTVTYQAEYYNDCVDNSLVLE